MESDVREIRARLDDIINFMYQEAIEASEHRGITMESLRRIDRTLCDACKDIEMLEEETSLARFAQRNPKFTITVLAVLVGAVAAGVVF